MDTILDFHKKNLVDTPAPTHVKSWLRPWTLITFIATLFCKTVVIKLCKTFNCSETNKV